MSATIVEQTAKNWEIFTLLCELDAELSVCDAERKEEIIAKAQDLCEELEVTGPGLND